MKREPGKKPDLRRYLEDDEYRCQLAQREIEERSSVSANTTSNRRSGSGE